MTLPVAKNRARANLTNKDFRSRTAKTKERRAKAFAKGKCSICCYRERRPDLRTCHECSNAGSKHRGRLREKFGIRPGGSLFFLCCQAFGFHRDDCERHP